MAYFDILGFSTVAKNEDIYKVRMIIKTGLLSVEEDVRKDHEWRFGRQRPTELIIFGDSILLWYNVPKNERGSEAESDYWFYFCSVCAKLMVRMFNRGLPLRGAISAGEFFIEQYCFGGKPIIECHKLAERSEWAGCGIVPAAWQRLEEIWPKTRSYCKAEMEQVCVNYAMPLKQAQPAPTLQPPSPYKVIKWFPVDRWKTDRIDPCVSDRVNAAFTAHGKKVGENEIGKVKNTKEFLESEAGRFVNSNRKRPNQAKES